MAKAKKNVTIAAAVVAIILVCVLATAMFSCSGAAGAANEHPELDGAQSEELAATDEDQSGDAVDAESEAAGEESVAESAQEVTADNPNVAGSSGVAASSSRSEPAASAPVSTPKSESVTPQDAQAAQRAHEHSWCAVKAPRTVVDQPAWTETQYETVERTICSVCGEDLTDGDSQGRSVIQHGKAHALAGEGGGYHSAFRQEAIGTIEHPAVTHIEYDITGYRCSTCGAIS